MAIAHATQNSRTAFEKGNLILDSQAWTLSGDTGNTLTWVTIAEGLAGKLTLDGTDNDCATAYYGAAPVLDPQTEGRVFGFTARFTLTEADTSNKDIDFYIGYSSIIDTTLWADADTLASGSYIGVAKYTASAFLRRIVQQATTNSGDTSASTYAIATATEYFVEVRGQVVNRAGTETIVVDVYCTDITNNGAPTQIGGGKISVSNASFAAMRPVFSLSTNGTNAEVCTVQEITPSIN